MLTKETLTQVEGLTEEQIKAIETLSKNDESVIIAKRIGRLHEDYERDIESVLGVKKPEGTGHTYDYLKSVLTDLKTKSESITGIETQITEKDQAIAELKSQIKEGSVDETLKQQLKDKSDEVESLKTKLSQQTEDWKAKESEFNGKIHNVAVDNLFTNEISNKKFVPDSQIPKEVRDVYVSNAKQKILGMKSEFVEDNGIKQLVFRDENGEIIRNAEDMNNPITVGYLVDQNLKGIFEQQREQNGGGQKPGSKTPNGKLSLNGVKTQVEADEMIEEHLISMGKKRTEPEFRELHKKLREENNVKELNIR